MTTTYRLLPPAHGYGPAIQCLVCGLISYHPADVRERYCAECYRFHEDALAPRGTSQTPEPVSDVSDRQTGLRPDDA